MLLYKTAALGLLSVLLVSSACYSKKQPAPAAAANGFAIVELFTSEGCSSCPAAETVLAEVRSEHQAHVYVMEFHVDYWDYIGWKDMFSNKDYTLRQQQYAQQFNLGSTYTPQAVVNGKSELVGSDRQKLHAAITNNLARQQEVTLTAVAKQDGSKVNVSYTTSAGKGQLINIALVQKDAETNVKRGENSGRKLKHINVVRVFNQSVALGNGSVSIDVPSGLNPADFMIVAYTQQKSDLKITGATGVSIQ